MQDKQTTLNLLETIRDVLNHEIFPNLPPNQANTAEMVKSGLNIVLRNLKNGSRTTINTKRQETSSNSTPVSKHNNSKSKVELQTQELTTEIRNGKYDENLLGPILSQLEQQIRQRLEVSNPEYLTESKFSQPKAV
ncbi:MAG: DUF6285 domain-containing protein [Thalassobaculaceae bacterium]